MPTGSRSALINRTIPSLFQGKSQQPASLRLASQCEDVVNAYPTLVDGLRKRPPLLHVGKLNTTTTTNRFVHFINRDAVEQYVVIIEDDDLKVYNLAGTAMTVNFPSGKGYLNVGSAAARDSFAVVTIADYTFIANKTVTCAMSGSVVSGALTGTVQRFTSLPAGALNQIYRIEGDNTNAFDVMFVKHNGTVWQECAAPGETFTFDAATMPHKLVRTAPSTFSFEPITWAGRACGNKASVPDPSFIGQKIRDIFLHRGRLGLLAGENIVLSSVPAADFRFYRETMASILDTDPIDTAASSNQVATLNYAIPFDKSLLLFSQFNQFILSGSNVLTPRSAVIDTATEFESSTSCRPVSAGSNAYFATPKGNWTSVREYFVDNDVLSTDAAEVTAHVPKFLPHPITHMAAANNDDALFLLSDATGHRNKIFVYKFYWQSEEKVQSSWGEWSFPSVTTIMGIGVVGTKLYVVTTDADGTHLGSIDIQAGILDPSDAMPFNVLLDRRALVTGVYDANNDWTTWTLPYELGTGNTVAVVYGPSWPSSKGKRLPNTTRPTSTTVRASGNYSAYACYVGAPYTFSYTFSEQFVRDGQTNSVQDGTIKMRSMILNYANSGYFEVKVTPRFRDTYTYKFTGNVVGGGITQIGEVTVTTGSFKFPVQADSRDATIVIENATHLPSTFQSAEWVGLYTPKSSR